MSEERIPIDEFAAQLRANATKSELAIKPLLESLGFEFQQVIVPYVVDFHHAETGVVVEIDGISHRGRGLEDRKREDELLDSGYVNVILRFSDQLAMSEHEQIRSVLNLHMEFIRARSALICEYTAFTRRSVFKYARTQMELSGKQWERGMSILGVSPTEVMAKAGPAKPQPELLKPPTPQERADLAAYQEAQKLVWAERMRADEVVRQARNAKLRAELEAKRLAKRALKLAAQEIQSVQ